MLKGEDFDETPAENLMAFSRKNCEQFAGYTNDGTGDDSKTDVLLHSKKRKYEQVRKQNASGSELVYDNVSLFQRNWLGAVLLLLG